MAHCTGCGAEATQGASFCARCGAPLAGGEGALERLIDARAKAIVAEEKAHEAAAQRAIAEQEDHDEQRRRLAADVEKASSALAENRKQPATLIGSCLSSTRRAALVALGIGLFPGCGVPIHLTVFPAIGTPAGVVCPWVCDGCSPHARAFSWNFKGSWHSENGKMGYAFVCQNPEIDVDTLKTTDLWDRKTNAKLQPYMLNGIATWLIEAVICAVLAALALGPLRGIRQRRRVLAERPVLEANLARAEEALRAFDHPEAEPQRPYR